MNPKIAKAIETYETYQMYCRAYEERTRQYPSGSREWEIVEADAMADMERTRKAIMEAQAALKA